MVPSPGNLLGNPLLSPFFFKDCPPNYFLPLSFLFFIQFFRSRFSKSEMLISPWSFLNATLLARSVRFLLARALSLSPPIGIPIFFLNFTDPGLSISKVSPRTDDPSRSCLFSCEDWANSTFLRKPFLSFFPRWLKMVIPLAFFFPLSSL